MPGTGLHARRHAGRASRNALPVFPRCLPTHPIFWRDTGMGPQGHIVVGITGHAVPGSYATSSTVHTNLDHGNAG